MALNLNGKQLLRIRTALTARFDRGQLEELLLHVDRYIADYASAQETDPAAALKIVMAAMRELWLQDLIQTALEQRPGDPTLGAILAELKPLLAAAGIDPLRVRLLREGYPFIDRQDLRDMLSELGAGHTRVFVIDGEPYSGRSYSTSLIHYLHENGGEFHRAVIDLLDYASRPGEGDGDGVERRSAEVTPGDLTGAMASLWKLKDAPQPMGEQDARFAIRFFNWLAGELEAAERPYWLVIDHFDKALLRDSAHELIHLLARETYGQIPALRIVLIGYGRVDELRSLVKAEVPVESVERIDETILFEYFEPEYEERRERDGTAFTDNDVVESVTRTLFEAERLAEQGDGPGTKLDGHPRRCEFIRRAAADEVRRLRGDG